MLASQQQSASSDGVTSQNPVHTGSEGQGSNDFDPLFDDRALDGLGGAAPPEHLHGGFNMFDFNHVWPLGSNMAEQPAYSFPEFNFEGSQPPSMNQGFNPLTPSQPVAQQHQWNPSNPFPPRNPSLNNLGSPKVFDSTAFSNAANVAGLGQHNQLSGATVNNQSNGPLSGTQMVGAGHGVPAQQDATHGASIGVQSSQVNRQAPHLTGFPLQTPTTSQTEPQETENPAAITSHLRFGAVVNGIGISPTHNQTTQARPPIPAPVPDEPNLGQDEGNLRMPDWLALVKPSPTKVITLRRDTHVALDILLERLPRQPPGGYSGIKIPATASVRNFAETSGRPSLEFRIYVTGAARNRRYETVCASCEKREGKKMGTPSFIDFCAANEFIEQKDGKARVEFVFCCYPKCHQDTGYSLDVVLSEDVNQTNIVAQYQLPFSFRVVAKLPQGKKRTRGQMEQPEETLAVDQRNVRARVDDLTQRGADDERNGHPMPPINPRNAGNPASQSTGPSGPNPTSSGNSRGSTNSIPPGASESLVPPMDNRHPVPPAEVVMPSHQCRQTVSTPSGEEITDLRDLVIDGANPSRGPTTGGPEIWISGSNFPTGLMLLYVRFGDNFARAVVRNPYTLSCVLPQANAPGTVPVALSRSPIPSAPVLGTSLCHFEYFTDLNELLPVIIRIQEDCTPEVATALDTLHKEMKKRNLKRNEKRPLREEETRHDEIETALIQALAPLQNTLDFGKLISKTNDYKQTLAHFAVLFGYTNLLRRLVGWNIDLTIADFNGFTALHCAYKKGDRVCVDLLLEKGASETVLDALGRAPSHLMPEGFASLNDNDTDMTSNDQSKLEQNHDAPSLFQNADSGHGVSDPGDEESMSHANVDDLMMQMFGQTETECQHASDLPSISDGPNVEHFGNPGSSEPLPGVSGTCPRPMRSIEPDMARQPQDSNFHISTIPTPSINYGSSPPISLHTIAPQYQRGADLHLPTSGLSQNNFGASPLLNPTIYSGLFRLADPMQLSQSSNTARDGQSDVPAFGTWVVDEGNGTPTSNELSLDELSLGQDEGTVGMPKWITFIKPLPQDGEKAITLHLDSHLALDIVLEHLPKRPPAGCDGIKVPATGSVRHCAITTGKTLLEFRIRLYGATTQQPYEFVCAICQKREGKRRGIPGLIDFKTDSDIIEPKDGYIRVEFGFCCYPKDHGLGDTEYLLEVVLSEDENQKHIVAQCWLPFSFNVVRKLSIAQAERSRSQIEREGDTMAISLHPIPEPTANGGVRSPLTNNRTFSGLLTPSLTQSLSPAGAVENPNRAPPGTPPNAVKSPSRAISPLRTDSECASALTDVNPDSGSLTGGARIYLIGRDFPAHFPLFARFGTSVVRTEFMNPHLLACNLPTATIPGLVHVTLSKHPQPSAPEIGTSVARLRYIEDNDQLIPILLRIQGQRYPELSPVLQVLLTTLNGPQQNRGLQGGSHGAGPGDDPIETSLIEALSCLQTRANFHEIVSTTNDYHQTLAHLAILYDYPSLLGRLVEWHIDLTIADVNGLTALHCAYMKGDLDITHILRKGGASEIATDKLGRTPSELWPEGLEGFDSDIDSTLAGSDAGSDAWSDASDINPTLAGSDAGPSSNRKRKLEAGVDAADEGPCFRDTDLPPEVQLAMSLLVRRIRLSTFFVNQTLEPTLGTLDANVLMAVAPSELWIGYGTRGKSIYSLFIRVDGEDCECLWCGDVQRGKLLRAIGHIRAKHLRHKPFICSLAHTDEKTCHTRFPTWEAMKDHQKKRRKHEEQGKNLCEVCGHSYVSISNLNRHKCLAKP